jgi:hypothetical protein
MINYQLGKVYEIVCLTTEKRYIGSTTRPLLCQRLTEHVKEHKNPSLRGTKSREVMEGGNYKMNLLEAYPCKSRDELNAKEYEWIHKLECVNKQGKIDRIEQNKINCQNYRLKKKLAPPPQDHK